VSCYKKRCFTLNKVGCKEFLKAMVKESVTLHENEHPVNWWPGHKVKCKHMQGALSGRLHTEGLCPCACPFLPITWLR